MRLGLKFFVKKSVDDPLRPGYQNVTNPISAITPTSLSLLYILGYYSSLRSSVLPTLGYYSALGLYSARKTMKMVCEIIPRPRQKYGELGLFHILNYNLDFSNKKQLKLPIAEG